MPRLPRLVSVVVLASMLISFAPAHAIAPASPAPQVARQPLAAAATGGATTRISIGYDGSQPDDVSDLCPSISADGRFVAFASYASNLVPGDTNSYEDVFVYDLEARQMIRVSVTSGGAQGDHSSDSPAISGDGRYVAFVSSARYLVPGDANGKQDIFVHDRQTGETTRVSVASDGTEGNDASFEPAISADGRYVAFYSWASTLAVPDANACGNLPVGHCSDVFIHDRQTHETSLVSRAADGAQGNSYSEQVAISADGRYLAFMSYASNLVPGDTNGCEDVFVRDRDADNDGIFDEPGAVSVTRISVASDGAQANNRSAWPAVSADGRFVAFESCASNLVAGDANNTYDVFVHDQVTHETTRISVASDGSEGIGASGGLYWKSTSLSADGRYVTFESSAPNLVLVPRDTNNRDDVFVHDRQTRDDVGLGGHGWLGG